MYQLWGGPPFKKHTNGNLKDRNGTEVYLLGDSRSILHTLASHELWKDTILSYVSTCDEPEWARECLTKFDIEHLRDGEKLTMHTLVHHHEIYKAYSKQKHFQTLQKKTNIAFSEMIFFDNQMNNIEDVSKLGVHCVYCPRGMTNKIWENGLDGWRERK
jgi:magnesium-dependent phosphatase 1